MKRAKPAAKKKPGKRGPKPDLLKIEGDWKDAMKKSLEKKKPPEGWPDNSPEQTKRPDLGNSGLSVSRGHCGAAQD